MKKIYISIIVIALAIVGISQYKSQKNNEVDKNATRPVYPVDKTAIYNSLLLANSKGNPNRYNTYLYFPNQKQLLNNIPKCVEPVKADATEYLKAYKKVYRYIASPS